MGAAQGDEGSPFDWLGYPLFDPEAARREPPPDPVVVEVDQEILAGYVGDFRFSGERMLSLKLEHGRLWGTTGDGQWSELAATSDTEFFIPGAEVRFRFEREGARSRPVVLVEGMEIPTERLEVDRPEPSDG